MTPAELKALKSGLKILQDDRARCEAEFVALSTRKRAIDEEIGRITGRIEQAESVPHITEHAMLRFVERSMGIDLAEVKAAMLTPNVIKAIKTLGSGHYPIGNGLKAVVKGSAVVSVTTKVEKSKPTPPRHHTKEQDQ